MSDGDRDPPEDTPTEESAEAPEPAKGRAETIGEWLAGKPVPNSAHLFLGLVVPAVIALVNMLRLKQHTVDDAYISYRYARNLARGLGLVYNEGERIEGYTNFLWTVILAAGIKVGIEPETLAKVLGCGFALGSMALVFFIDHRLRPHTIVPCCATWLLASTSAFMGYAVWGLETTMFAFFVLAGLMLFIDEEEQDKKLPLSGLAFAAAGLTRPEAPMYLGLSMLFLAGPAIAPLERLRGPLKMKDPERDRLPLLLLALMLIAGGVFLYQFSTERSKSVIYAVALAMVGVIATVALVSRRFLGRRNLLRAALFAAPIACHVAWRHSYYGSWLPNTLSAKTGNLQQQLAGGIDYLLKYIDQEGAILYVAFFGVAAGVVWRNRWVLAASAISVFGAVYVLLVGGDWMPLFRFAVPLQPFLFLLVGLGLRVIVEQKNRLLNYGMLLFCIVTVGERSYRLRQDRKVIVAQERHFWDSAAGGTARWFQKQIDERGRDDVYGAIALGDIGQVGYDTDFPILDLLGLVDPVISSLPGGYTTKIGKGFRDRFYDGAPRYFVLISAENDCEHPSVVGSRVLYSDARFRQSYALTGRVKLDAGFSWCIYEHKSTWDPSHVQEPPSDPKKPAIIRLPQ